MNKLTEIFIKTVAQVDKQDGIDVLKSMGADKEQVKMAKAELKKKDKH